MRALAVAIMAACAPGVSIDSGTDVAPACADASAGALTLHLASGMERTRLSTAAWQCSIDELGLSCGDWQNGGPSSFGLYWTVQAAPRVGRVYRIGADVLVRSARVCARDCAQFNTEWQPLDRGTLSVTVLGTRSAIIEGCAMNDPGDVLTFGALRF